MLKVLIVEDEEMIRKGIVLATDWQSLGCVVVGEAANGEEGIAQAEKCRPSLIITAGTPSRSTGCVCQKSEPEQKSAFSSSVICWMIFSMSIL